MENFTAKDLFAKVKSSLRSSIRSFMRSISTVQAEGRERKSTAPLSASHATSAVASDTGDALDVLLKNLRTGDSEEITRAISIGGIQTSAVPIAVPILTASTAVSLGGIKPVLSSVESITKSKTKVSSVSIGGLLAIRKGQ
jgi:hypothetical protein